jgi:predicted TIM-barrel fold metal-dependent hydrolase
MKNKTWSRRRFLQQTSAGIAAAGIVARSGLAANNLQAPPVKPPPAAPSAGHGPANVAEANSLKWYNIWDAHTHLGGFAGDTIEQKVAACLKFADLMGVERMLVLNSSSFGHDPDGAKLRAGNDVTIKAVKLAPDRLFGCAFMYPADLQACLDEIYRCIRDGPLVGLKFEFDTPRLANSSELDPIFERAAEVHAVIMHHTFIITGGNKVGESSPMELVEVAKRFPTVQTFCGHTGGTWEMGIRPLRGVKNIYADLSGSDPTSGFTEMAVRELGADHVLYGSDIAGRSFASQISKVLGANISDADRRLVLGGNLRRIMEPIMKARGMKI